MEQRNLFAALAISLAIIVGFQYFYEIPQRERALREQAAKSQSTEQAPSSSQAPATSTPPQAPGSAPPAIQGAAASPATHEAALAAGPRVRINTPRLHGSIALVGARFDDLTLADYHETTDPKSPEIKLLSPVGAPGAYFTEFGWTTTASPKLALPGADTVWHANRDTLSPNSPVTLTWNNGEGLVFTRTISIDENYMFTVTDRVENTGPAAVPLYPYGLISRWETPPTAGFYILHEGPLAVLNNQLEEPNYKALREDGAIKKVSTTGGWVGITDKYWMVVLAPEKVERLEANFAYQGQNGQDKYQADYIGTEALTVAPGGFLETRSLMFAGAKQVPLLDTYAEKYGVEKLDRAVVFRWLYFVARPLFYGLLEINKVTGNFGIAILLLTVMVKLLFFPLANKSYRSMSRMKALQPEMTKIRERYAEDKQRMQQEMMALYKREKVHPASGCLPILVQIPVFFCLYEVLYVTIEMRHAPFYGWIKDLSAPDPTTLFNLFGLIAYQPPHFLMIGAWPLIMGITMFLQQKLNPQPPDPIQARLFLMMPVIFTVILASFPSGLVIYWTWNNLLSITQQWVIMKRTKIRKR